MTSKSFPSAAATISLATVLLAMAGIPLDAQQASATPAASATPRVKSGNLRFWNMTPPTSGIILEAVTGTSPDARALISAGPANYFATYNTLAPGSYALRIFRAGNRQQIIKSFDLALKDRSYFTLIATQEPGGQVAVELIDDTPDPTKTPKNCLMIRQFCRDMTVTVSASGNFKSDALPYGRTVALEGLPDGIAELNVRAIKAGGTVVKSWDTQADFHLAHHYTLFIVNDLYGRMRARTAIDGPSPDEEAAAAAEAARNNPR